MPKSPIGKRPRPRVARDHSPSFNTDNTGRARGVSSTKSPTGSRPVPQVAKNSPREPSPPSASPVKPKHQTMPKPKTRWAKRGGGKPHGGK
jgi:hypothetical protein